MIKLLGYATFGENGLFKWAYLDYKKALAHTKDPRYICKVGWDDSINELCIEMPSDKEVARSLYIDQFWCLTHDYWMRKVMIYEG